MPGRSLRRRERGWPMPPAAPRTATLAAPFGREVEEEVGEMFIACVGGGMGGSKGCWVDKPKHG